MNIRIENFMSKKCRNILENVCFSKIFTNFAFPKLRRSSPNQLMLLKPLRIVGLHRSRLRLPVRQSRVI